MLQLHSPLPVVKDRLCDVEAHQRSPDLQETISTPTWESVFSAAFSANIQGQAWGASQAETLYEVMLLGVRALAQNVKRANQRRGSLERLKNNPYTTRLSADNASPRGLDAYTMGLGTVGVSRSILKPSRNPPN